ncbi:MAG: hypothetical protein K5777_07190 [Nitrosopumilus sp.]|nr:hypothetical protein [Nitrosopumilus sp.]
MTRFQNKKSVGLTAIMALIVLMAMGVDDVFGDHQADNLVHEFGELLDGVEAEILKIPTVQESSVDTTDTMQTGEIFLQTAYLDAFDEVIRTQIL